MRMPTEGAHTPCNRAVRSSSLLVVNGKRRLTSFRQLKTDHLRFYLSSVAAVGTRPRAGWQDEPSNLEEIVLSYLRSPDASALPGPDSPDSDAWTAVTV